MCLCSDYDDCILFWLVVKKHALHRPKKKMTSNLTSQFRFERFICEFSFLVEQIFIALFTHSHNVWISIQTRLNSNISFFFYLFSRIFLVFFILCVDSAHRLCTRSEFYSIELLFIVAHVWVCVCVWIEQPFSIRCKRKIIIFIVAFRSDKDTNRHNERMNLHPFERAVYMKILT